MQVKECSMWEFLAAVEGFSKANSPEETGLTDTEKDELAEWLGI